MSDKRADIYTVRPRGEDFKDSCNAIKAELKTVGLKSSRIIEGITQPDGSKMFWVYLKE